MNILVNVQGREAILVRSIPFVTGWRVSPDVVAEDLAGWRDPVAPGGIPGLRAFSLNDEGEPVNLAPKEFDHFAIALRALREKFDATGLKGGSDIRREAWRVQSTKRLPSGAFVWRDEFEDVFKRQHSRYRMGISGEREGDRDLNFSPLIPDELEDIWKVPTGKDVMSYLKARDFLSRRWGAGEGEIAIWIWGGDLNAYWHAGNPNGPLILFSFSEAQDKLDYKKTLLSLSFSRLDIVTIEIDPHLGRCLTGLQVIARWMKYCTEDEAIEILRSNSGAGTENLSVGKLTPLHPLDIAERKVEDCLFRVHQVDRFEKEHFAEAVTSSDQLESKQAVVDGTPDEYFGNGKVVKSESQRKMDDLDLLLTATLIGLREKNKGTSNREIYKALEEYDNDSIIKEIEHGKIYWVDPVSGNEQIPTGFKAMANRMIRIREENP